MNYGLRFPVLSWQEVSLQWSCYIPSFLTSGYFSFLSAQISVVTLLCQQQGILIQRTAGYLFGTVILEFVVWENPTVSKILRPVCMAPTTMQHLNLGAI